MATDRSGEEVKGIVYRVHTVNIVMRIEGGGWKDKRWNVPGTHLANNHMRERGERGRRRMSRGERRRGEWWTGRRSR
jgi:hypothetical protein